jgi:anti-sigma factor RsiW
VACEQSQSVAHAYLDGELDAVRAAEFEQHLAVCPDCAAVVSSGDEVRGGIQHTGLREIAPARLKERVYADLHRARQSAAPPRRTNYAAWLAAAAAIVLALVLASKFIPNRDGGNVPPQLVAQVIDAHLRSLQPGHLMDVVSTDQHTVKPWFAGRADVSPVVADFAAQGYVLLGGRADYLNRQRAAVLVYRHGAHIVDVFAWAADGHALAARTTRSGYHLVSWRVGDLEYCAVSDAGWEELGALERLLRERAMLDTGN